MAINYLLLHFRMPSNQCPVCQHQSATIKTSRLVADHFNLHVFCPICWKVCSKISNLQRHLSTRHPSHELTERKREINVNSGFYLAQEPKYWLPQEKPIRNSFSALLDALFGYKLKPDKKLLKCPTSIEEAVKRKLFKINDHKSDGPPPTPPVPSHSLLEASGCASNPKSPLAALPSGPSSPSLFLTATSQIVPSPSAHIVRIYAPEVEPVSPPASPSPSPDLPALKDSLAYLTLPGRNGLIRYS